MVYNSLSYSISERDFWRITRPIFADNFLRMSKVLISYWLFSCISDQAAALMGVSNAYLLLGFTITGCLAQSKWNAFAIKPGSQLLVLSVILNVLKGLSAFIIFVYMQIKSRK